MFEVNNKDTRVSSGVYQGVFTPCSSVSFVNFGQINAGWVRLKTIQKMNFKKITKKRR